MKKSRPLQERKKRAQLLIGVLKKLYPTPQSELTYATPFQFVVAVILSAQCTDKKVNEVTDKIFKRYKTPKDFGKAKLETFQKEISTIPFFRNKAKNIISAAKLLEEKFGGAVPRTIGEMVELPGVAYKTANVVLGEVHEIWDGIATDTHVRRFALRFDLTESTDLFKISKDLENLIPKKDWKYVNNGFVLYGRYVCPARKHDCEAHPLTKIYPKAAKVWPTSK